MNMSVGVYTILTICLFTTLYSLVCKIYNSLAIVVHKKQHPQHINLTSFCESGKNPTVDLAKLNYIQLLLWTQMRKFCSWYTPTKTLIMKLSNCLFSLIKPKTKKLPWFSQSKRRISFPWLHLRKAQVEESPNLSWFLEAHLGAPPSETRPV